MSDLLLKSSKAAIPLDLVTKDGLKGWLAGLSEAERAWAENAGFKAKPGSTIVLPDSAGAPASAAMGVESLDHV